MSIDLDDLRMDAPSKPTREWTLNGRAYEEYLVGAYASTSSASDVRVGCVRICRGLNRAGFADDFYLDFSQDPPLPRPYVNYQETIVAYRGRGLNGSLIVFANDFYRENFNSVLYSDTHFVFSTREHTKNVWRKLESAGLAKFEPYRSDSGELLDRWVMR